MADRTDLLLRDWEILQKKIFTRWVNQKLMSRHLPTIDDVLTDIGKGDNLANLLFALSEKEMPKPKNPPKLIIMAQKIEHVGKALEFVYSCGVEMKLKPSPDNVLKGDFRDIMALMWAIMMKFMKFDESDEEQLSAKDALLRWLQFHTKEYENVQITNLTKSFHNGIAFCALVHKFKPDSIPYATLQPTDALGNLKLAMDMAEQHYKIEQYIKPEEIAKLDDKSMLVYCSEYYYGINEAAKRALAAKRISKLIKFTRENDEMKVKYEADGAVLLGHLGSAEQLLVDVAMIDNTMAGAKKRLADFDQYKTESKRAILTLQLEMEAQFSSLALRLSNNNRPVFSPSDGNTAPDVLKGRIAEIHGKEAVEPILHAELNRQLKLVQLDKRHEAQSRNLQQWIAVKTGYTRDTPEVASSGEARKQLKLFDAYEMEYASMDSDTFAELKAVGAELTAEHYEASDAVAARETASADGLTVLATQAAAKKPILEDNLAREQFKERIRLVVMVHSDVSAKLQRWHGEKVAYLDAKASGASVQDAQLHLSLLEAFNGEKGDMQAGSEARLQALGEEIRSAKYETSYSAWVYEEPDQITALESSAAANMATLADKSTGRQEILEDDLAREQLKEKVELWVGNHRALSDRLKAWGADKLAYLGTKEEVQSSAVAKYQLSLLESFDKEKADTTVGALASLKKLGADVCSTGYLTEHSQWKYPEPAAVAALETEADALWQLMARQYEEKKAVLEDDQAREEFAEHTRLLAGQHEGKYTGAVQWGSEKTKELEAEISVGSIGDAQYLLSLLESYSSEKEGMTASAVASLKQLGAAILAREYKTALSSYVYENAAEIQGHEANVDATWADLDTLGSQRKTTLEELLAREIRKEELRLEFADLALDFTRFCSDKITSIGSDEEQKTIFGSSLADVTEYAAKLAAGTAAIQTTVADKTSSYTAVDTEMTTLEVTVNPYTQLTVANLVESHASLSSAIASRQQTYDTELARRKEDDRLCREFAAVVGPFNVMIAERTGAVVDSSASEEDQLEAVEGALASLSEHAGVIPEAKRLAQGLTARGIESNIHTVVSAEDVEASWANYQQILEQKKPYLEKVIEYKLYRGISPEQYHEMEEVFKTYDKDNSGSINAKEMRTCLFSLGEERTKSQIEGYMAEFGKGGVLLFEAFRELMVTLLGDTGTRDGMLESFKLISRGQEFVKSEDLGELLEADCLAYFEGAAPALEDGRDFTVWCDDVLSR